MKENTNSAIVFNSIVLYVRLFITAACSIVSTRFALRALGIDGFGLYSVIGSVITLISLLNCIMVSVSQRFISVAMGRNQTDEIREQFSINFIIHLGIAVFTLLLAIPIGYWYVYYKLNYGGDLNEAFIVYIVSCIAAVISFVGVPYNGLLVAKERFIVFCFPDVISGILKLVISYLLVAHFNNKLIIYATMMAILNTYPVFVYSLFCKRKYPEVVKLVRVKNIKKIKEVLSYSVWIAYGAFASMAKSQGAAVLINRFFSTAMNSALGLATSVTQYISMFAENLSRPMAPQIMKFYASDNAERSYKLLIFSIKISYLVIFLISVPFFVEADWIINLWLGEVPPYITLFLKFLIIDSLVQSFNGGVANLIFANGNIRLYQICSNSLKVLSVVAAYISLRFGLPAESLLISYIVFSVIISIVNPIILQITTGFSSWTLISQSYLPCLIITILTSPLFIIPLPFSPLFVILLVTIYVLLLEYFIGLNRTERASLMALLNNWHLWGGK